MKHDRLYSIFKDKFVLKDSDIEEWFPNGKNAIRIVFPSTKELIFTYYHENEWRLETKQSWINHMNGVKDYEN